MSDMSARLILCSVKPILSGNDQGTKQQMIVGERLWFYILSDMFVYTETNDTPENNSHSEYVGKLVTNPDLFGKFKVGDIFSVEFTKLSSMV